MSHMDAVALDLLVNAVLPFVFAWGAVRVVLRVFRVADDGYRLALLLLPLVRLSWGVAAGIPAASFLWAHRSGIVRESGSLMVGVSPAAPFGLSLSFAMTANVAGRRYPLSLGDLTVLGCDRLASWCVPALLSLVVAVSVFLLLRRLVGAIRFGAQRASACSRAIAHHRVRRGARWIDVYITDDDAMSTTTPHAGGLLAPFVCIPLRVFASLTPRERHAVIQHELSHLEQHHIVVLWAVRILSDVFWFVPGGAWLRREIARTCECLADDGAVRNGAGAVELASAMVKVGEQVRGIAPASEPLLVLGRTSSHLARRVERLLDRPAASAPRFGWRWMPVRLLVFLATAQTVLMTMVFSNR